MRFLIQRRSSTGFGGIRLSNRATACHWTLIRGRAIYHGERLRLAFAALKVIMAASFAGILAPARSFKYGKTSRSAVTSPARGVRKHRKMGICRERHCG